MKIKAIGRAWRIGLPAFAFALAFPVYSTALAAEVERQIQLRQNAWSERLAQSRQELDDQRATHEAERTALMQQQHKKLLEVSEESKNQVAQARRQARHLDLHFAHVLLRETHFLAFLDQLEIRDVVQAGFSYTTAKQGIKYGFNTSIVVGP